MCLWSLLSLTLRRGEGGRWTQVLEHSFFRLSRVLFSPELPITAQVPVESQPCREEEKSLPWLGHLHTEGPLKWQHQLNVVGLPCVELSTGTHHSSHLYPLQIFHRKRYNGKKGSLRSLACKFWMSIWRNSSGGKGWALPAVLQLGFPPSVTHWEQSRDTPAASDSLHSSAFSPPTHSSEVFPTEEIPPQLWSCEANALSFTILWAQNK